MQPIRYSLSSCSSIINERDCLVDSGTDSDTRGVVEDAIADDAICTFALASSSGALSTGGVTVGPVVGGAGEGARGRPGTTASTSSSRVRLKEVMASVSSQACHSTPASRGNIQGRSVSARIKELIKIPFFILQYSLNI